ncbi:hypothetical protein STEG23_033723, partial [Scotinomys teguina]
EWIRKMWFIYTMEYYAAEKNNDIMKFAGKWMELENVILSEVHKQSSGLRPLLLHNWLAKCTTTVACPPSILPPYTLYQYIRINEMQGINKMDTNISLLMNMSTGNLMNMSARTQSVSAGYTALNVFSYLMLAVTFVLGVLGNGLVIWVAGFRMIHTVTTISYLNLAIADFCFTSTLPFFIASMAMGQQWPFGWFMCKFIFTIVDINLFGSVFLIALIALDRCICVLHPVWAQNHRTVSLAKKVIIGPWMCAFLLTLPVIIRVTTIPDKLGPGKTACTFDFSPWTTDPVEKQKVAITMLTVRGIIRFIIGFSTPMSIVAICYGLIATKIYRQGLIKSSRPLRVLSFVVAAFFLCWCPFQPISAPPSAATCYAAYPVILHLLFMAGWRLLCCLALDSSSSFPCPAFLAIAKS